MNGDGNEWIFYSIFKIQNAGYLSTSKSREARSTAIPSFLKGHADEQVSLGKVRWKGVLDQAPLRAVSALLMGAVNGLGSVCRECWAKEVSFPGVGTSGSAPLTLESLINTECRLGPLPRHRSSRVGLGQRIGISKLAGEASAARRGPCRGLPQTPLCELLGKVVPQEEPDVVK